MRKRISIPSIVSAVILVAVAIAIIVGPFVTGAATKQSIMDALLTPGSSGHLLGTDALGRDIGLLAIAGAMSAVLGPVAIALGSMVLGIAFGGMAGYFGHRVDGFIGRIADLLFSLPVLLIAIVVAGIFDAGYWMTVLLLVVLFSPSDIRIIRSGVLEQVNLPYVEAAEMLSIPHWRILFFHVIPNVWNLILTNLLLNTSVALVTLSSLSYLGVGVRPGSADWGRQIADGRTIIFDNPAAVLVPSLLIVAVAMSLNLIGDWVSSRNELRGIQ